MNSLKKYINNLVENNMNIKISELKQVIRVIVENIVREMDMTNEQSMAAAAGPVSGPMSLRKKSFEAITPLSGMEEDEVAIKEINTTGGVDGYKTRKAFTSNGGSEAGVAGSEKLGYKLTPIGKQEMNRHADRLR